MDGIIRIAPLVFGLLMVVTGAYGMAGRLPKNDWVGLRLHVVMENERTWEVGHRAGGPWLLGTGFVVAAGGLALRILYPEPGTGLRFAFVFMLLAFAGYGIAAAKAQAAVRRMR